VAEDSVEAVDFVGFAIGFALGFAVDFVGVGFLVDFGAGLIGLAGTLDAIESSKGPDCAI
jgi:hypothetical protein